MVLVFYGRLSVIAWKWYVQSIQWLHACVQVQKKKFTADTTTHTASPPQGSPSLTASHDVSSKSHDSQMNSNSDRQE